MLDRLKLTPVMLVMDWLSRLFEMLPVRGRLDLRSSYSAPWRIDQGSAGCRSARSRGLPQLLASQSPAAPAPKRECCGREISFKAKVSRL